MGRAQNLAFGVLLTPPTALAHLRPLSLPISLQFTLISCWQPNLSFFQLLSRLPIFPSFEAHSNHSLPPNAVAHKVLFFKMFCKSPPRINLFILLPWRNCPQLFHHCM